MAEIERRELALSEKIVDSFKPNYRTSPYSSRALISKHHGWIEVEKIDLSSLPLQTLISVRCFHPSASYLLKLLENQDGREVGIWHNLNSNGLKGPINSIVSVGEDYDVERGTVRKGAGAILPYFEYKPNPENPEQISICEPKTFWMDTYKHILIKDE